MNEKLKGKRLLIMGGTQISCEIVRAAQKYGIIAIVADYNTVEDSPAKQIADEHYQVDIIDVDAVVSFIKEKNIDGVITGFSDMLLPYYAQICKKANLPYYASKEQFDLFINKDKYKELCREFGVPTVEEYAINEEDWINSTKDIKYPVLVKPADSSGARGINICYNVSELKESYGKAKEYSKSGKILVERYLSGREVTVFWVFQDGDYYVSMIGNRHVKKNQDGVIPLPVGYTFPASVTNSYLKEIAPKAKKMFQAAGLKNGIMFMQCKVEGSEVVVYDIGYRLTGSLEYKILEAACGYNTMDMMIHFALTGKMSDDPLEPKVNPYLGKKAYNISFLGKPGKINSICGVNDARTVSGVLDIVIEHYEGETITEQMKGLLAQICIRVLGVLDDTKDDIGVISQIQDMISIKSESGDEMKLPGLEADDFKFFADVKNELVD